MGSKCFRPVNKQNQPVYITSLNNALIEAEKICTTKNQKNLLMLDQIIKNQNRKGNLKKLFDHLISHQNNILHAIKYCYKRTTIQKTYSCIVIASMFCQKLVKMIKQKKILIQNIQKQQTSKTKISNSIKNLLTTDYQFRNLLHQLESHFFQLVIRILVYNNENSIQNLVSETLIEYSNTTEQKITAKKELKSILDLYLTIVLQKNVQLINKKTYLTFYAYSALLVRSKTDLFTSQFIQKHFNFILRIFFQLQDCKQSNQTLVDSQQFSMFQDCVQTIVKDFILFSTQNKSIKDRIIQQIMYQLDSQRFNTQKTQKLQRIIKQNIILYSRQQIMKTWLAQLINYIRRIYFSQSQSMMMMNLKDSRKETIKQTNNTHNHSIFVNSLKNACIIQSRINAIQTLKRWFQQDLLNVQKALEYFSQKIFQALLVNLYNVNGHNQELNLKSQQVLVYLLKVDPQKLSQLLSVFSRQLRKPKHQYYYPLHKTLVSVFVGDGGTSSSGNLGKDDGIADLKKDGSLKIQRENIQRIWENDIFFLQNKITEKSVIAIKYQEIEEIYSPVIKQQHLSINLVYLIELAGITVAYLDIENIQIQRIVYNYLISLTSCMRMLDSEIYVYYQQKLAKKTQFLLTELNKKSPMLLYSFLKHTLKNVQKQDHDNEVWIQLFILIIIINIVICQSPSSSSKPNKKRLSQLNSILNQIWLKLNFSIYQPKQIHLLYFKYKNFLQIAEIFSDPKQKNKFQSLERLQQKLSTQIVAKSNTNIQNSIISEKIELSESNPDTQFKRIIGMVKTT